MATGETKAPLHRGPLAAGLAAVERLRFAWNRLGSDLRCAVGLGLEFEPREDDVYVVGYPRSGGTFLQVVLLELAGRGGFDFVHLASRSPNLDLELTRGNGRFLAALPSPRILRSFRRREELPRHGRFVYAARDLYDVAASSYRHASLLLGYEPERGRFLRRFLRGGHLSMSPSWFDHLRSWWPHRNDPDVLFLDYDEMVGDLDGTIRRVAAFAGLPLDESRMPEIRERCSLASMKRHAAKLDPRLRRIDEEEVAFIRGARGAKRPELPPAERRLIAAQAQSLARRLGVRPDDPLAGLFKA